MNIIHITYCQTRQILLIVGFKIKNLESFCHKEIKYSGAVNLACIPVPWETEAGGSFEPKSFGA